MVLRVLAYFRDEKNGERLKPEYINSSCISEFLFTSQFDIALDLCRKGDVDILVTELILIKDLKKLLDDNINTIALVYSEMFLIEINSWDQRAIFYPISIENSTHGAGQKDSLLNELRTISDNIFTYLPIKESVYFPYTFNVNRIAEKLKSGKWVLPHFFPSFLLCFENKFVSKQLENILTNKTGYSVSSCGDLKEAWKKLDQIEACILLTENAMIQSKNKFLNEMQFARKIVVDDTIMNCLKQSENNVAQAKLVISNFERMLSTFIKTTTYKKNSQIRNFVMNISSGGMKDENLMTAKPMRKVPELEVLILLKDRNFRSTVRELIEKEYCLGKVRETDSFKTATRIYKNISPDLLITEAFYFRNMFRLTCGDPFSRVIVLTAENISDEEMMYGVQENDNRVIVGTEIEDKALKSVIEDILESSKRHYSYFHFTQIRKARKEIPNKLN
jgi:hypothetical protein